MSGTSSSQSLERITLGPVALAILPALISAAATGVATAATAAMGILQKDQMGMTFENVSGEDLNVRMSDSRFGHKVDDIHDKIVCAISPMTWFEMWKKDKPVQARGVKSLDDLSKADSGLLRTYISGSSLLAENFQSCILRTGKSSNINHTVVLSATSFAIACAVKYGELREYRAACGISDVPWMKEQTKNWTDIDAVRDLLWKGGDTRLPNRTSNGAQRKITFKPKHREYRISCNFSAAQTTEFSIVTDGFNSEVQV